MNYWKNREYLGFGLASHGYFEHNMYSHVISLEGYITNPLPLNTKLIRINEHMDEDVILNLRTK